MQHISILRKGTLSNKTESQLLQYMAASDPDNNDVNFSSLFPFSINPQTRRLDIDKAMVENTYREPVPLDFQWGDGSMYGFFRRSRSDFVLILGENYPKE